MSKKPTTPEERAAAIASLNKRQNRRNLFTNIGEVEVRREVLKMRKKSAVTELLDAAKLMQDALTEHRLRDVKKRFSLCVADAALSSAIAKVKGKSEPFFAWEAK
jgi:hypothetical protein